jgi:hypothetical protein
MLLNCLGDVLLYLPNFRQRLHKLSYKDHVVNQPHVEPIARHINVYHVRSTLAHKVIADFYFDPELLANTLKQTGRHKALLVTVKLFALSI